MIFHLQTAMQLTATMTLIIGVAMALTVSTYPVELQRPLRLWMRSLLLQPIGFFLMALRGSIPDLFSIIVANILLLLAFAHLVAALRVYANRTSLVLPLGGLVILGTIAVTLMTYVWPSLGARTALVSVIYVVYSLIGIMALRQPTERATRPEHMVAVMLGIGTLIFVVRVLRAPSIGMVDFVEFTPTQGAVFTYAALMPVVATYGFLLMCGERLNVNLVRLATIDPLTGTFNRRNMTERAEAAITASRRLGQPLALLVLDLDHFKRVNDEFGHEVGDLALCRFVDSVREQVGSDEVFARMGGEEFVLVLPNCNERTAMQRAEAIRAALEALVFTASGWQVPLRVSIGVAALGPQVTSLESLLREADRALYRAKREGRNRVVAASMTQTQVPDELARSRRHADLDRGGA